MSVTVERITSQREELWMVRFGIHRVQFRHERCSNEFATKLKARMEMSSSYPRMVSNDAAGPSK